MIRVKGLDFAYPEGDFRLSVPELTVNPGETIALIGPSGSGKTTLLDLVAGNRVPGSGSIEVAGQSIVGLSDGQRRDLRIRTIGMVFQEFELLDYLSVLDNVLLPYRITRALDLDAEVRRRAMRLIDGVGLEDKRTRNVRRLSQGERQRVAVCRALVTRPSILLCDEPTGNLDPVNKDQVLDLLFDHVTENGITLIAVTHDRDLLPRFDRVIDFKEFHLADPGRPDSGLADAGRSDAGGGDG
jgi:putative ABC transport system ATP-binding protein